MCESKGRATIGDTHERGREAQSKTEEKSNNSLTEQSGSSKWKSERQSAVETTHKEGEKGRGGDIDGRNKGELERA